MALTLSRRFDHPTPPKLHCIFLDQSVVLPALQLTLPIPDDIVTPILKLIQNTEYPILGVFPLTAPPESIPFEYGCAARIVRVSRPSARISSGSPKPLYNITLQGLSRIRIADKFPIPLPPSNTLNEFAVTYPSLHTDNGINSELPSKEIVHAFRSAAFRLLDRLELEPSAPTGPVSSLPNNRLRPDVWRRLQSLVQDVTPEGAVWLADIIMGVTVTDFADKLAFLAVSGVQDRLRKATEIFNKQADILEVSSKISQEVGESFSNQQKEFFLRQQLQAIQKELTRLQRSRSSLPSKSLSSSSNPSSAPNTSNNTNNNPTSDLDDDQDEGDELADLRKKIEFMRVGSEERKMAAREWKRLRRIPGGSVESGVVRNYLEWLTSLPWAGTTPSSSSSASSQAETILEPDFLSKARAQLEADHYGLEKIKRRLIEYLAVVRLKALLAKRDAVIVEVGGDKGAKDSTSGVAAAPLPKAETLPNKGPILLLVGPPGSGKTSIAQSVARALSRPFQRISLGGVRDEAEIRGHRRTYVASGPGAIVQSLRRAGRGDMVLLLDEIDKVGHTNYNGDPSAALLEVLDPEQNHTFTDHYINVPVDLSQVMFIATANSLDGMSAPLLDRCEVIHLSGYTYDEKIHIAKRYLIPKQLKINGLPSTEFEISEEALQHIASRYTREAGVRTLERQIGSVVRYKAVQWSDSRDASMSASQSTSSPSSKQESEYKKLVEVRDLQGILGLEWYHPEEREVSGKRGIVNGLVVQGEGEGGILSVETLLVPGSGRLRLTGSLGEVIKESGELALSWVKANAYSLGITSTRGTDPLDNQDIHLHLPAGAQKKDGPSAGLAMICAFVSLLTGAIVPSTLAMTGEVSLRGGVMPVGGIKEKVLGAHRAGVRTVILPARNRKEYEYEFGDGNSTHTVRKEMRVVFVSSVREGLEAAFEGALVWREGEGRVGGGATFVESRL